MNIRNYNLESLVKIAKRENNKKRSYLYVNVIQGKHMPVDPVISLNLFSIMAEQLEREYPGEKLLVIGFAETATAIGASMACKANNVSYYINTTREIIPGSECICFSEVHSHASEQKLVVDGLSEAIKQVDRIVFAEDEVTTGNTIKNLIRMLNQKFPGDVKRFTIISILNSMSLNRIREFREKGIECLYIFKIPEKYRHNDIEKYKYEKLTSSFTGCCCYKFKLIDIYGRWNSRIVCNINTIQKKLQLFIQQLLHKVSDFDLHGKILILGTEEFMFPAIMFGEALKNNDQDISVMMHATTRSPIEISTDVQYPLHKRWTLRSMYDSQRITYVYNLEKYDTVFIVTDAQQIRDESISDLLGALQNIGNTEIILVRWLN